MNCQKCKIEIEERDPRRERLSDAAEAHLAACAGCRLFGEERLALLRLVGGLERVSAPADFDFRMRARLSAESRAHTPERERRFSFSPAALSWPLAACLALVVGASLYYQQRTQTVAAPPEEQARARPTSQQAQADEAAPGVVQAPSAERRSTTASHLMKNSLAARRRERPERNAERIGVETPRRGASGEDSNSTSLMSASPVKYDARSARASAPIPVQVAATERPLQVLLRDRSGEARTISVESVSFGSRDVIGRPATTFTKASHSSNQGVW